MNKFFDDQAGQKRATIGPSITIKGEVSGAEDLLVEGMVEGTISLKENEPLEENLFKTSFHLLKMRK